MPNSEMSPDVHVYHRGDKSSRGNVLIFKGQGFVKPGIGKDLWEHHDTVKDVYRVVDQIADRPISAISFEDPDGDLLQTRNAQLATVAYNESRRRVGMETEHPDFKDPFAYTAGNSLGEYSALVAAGALTFEEQVRLVVLRSEFMQDAQDENPGSLATPLLSKDYDKRQRQMEEVEKAAKLSGIVPCLYNSDNQIVFGGTHDELAVATGLLKDAGVKLTALKTDGAFHHPVLMKPAADRLVPVLDKADIRDAEIPVVINATAQPVWAASDIRQGLKDQMVQPVLWGESMDFLIHEGFNMNVEIGEKPTFLDMVKDHPLFAAGAAIGTTAVVAGGLIIAHTLSHPHHKKN